MTSANFAAAVDAPTRARWCGLVEERRATERRRYAGARLK
jgi:hypothetical protein